MSTWYYAVCDQHKVVSDIIGGRNFPNRWWWAEDENGVLAQFLEEHGDCKPAPQILSEHDDRTFEYREERE